jgi:ribulose bisphosphate carboxylase small subunit
MPKLPEISEETLQKLARAKVILTDPVTEEILQLLEGQYTAAWKHAKTTEDREHAWYMYQALCDVKRSFDILSENYEVWQASQNPDAV